MKNFQVKVLAITILILGMGLLLYPMTSQWFASIELAKRGANYEASLPAENLRTELIAQAQSYNEELPGIAATDPFGGTLAAPDSDVYADYLKQLALPEVTEMGRITIPKLNIDLPIYHGTSADALGQGVGHLFGTALPVGQSQDQLDDPQVSTHSVLTAHSGLANREFFTHLEDLAVGDTFDVHILGETYRYQVTGYEEVLPTETEALAVQAGKDLMTLVTCTPIGVNTHRLLVTAHRVGLDVPQAPAVEVSTPAFPWWIVFAMAGITMILILVRVHSKRHQST